MKEGIREKISKSKIFFGLSLSFLTGVFGASFFEIENIFWLMLLAGAVAILTLNYQNKKAWLVSAAILFFVFGLWRTNIARQAAQSNLNNRQSGPVEEVGTIIREPEIGEKSQKILVEVPERERENRLERQKENPSSSNEEDRSSSPKENHFRLPVYWYEKFFPKKERILVDADLYPAYSYGDEVEIKCVLQAPKNYENSRFDYQMYLAKDGIYRLCAKPQLALRAKNKGSRIYAAIMGVKNKFEEKLSAIFPDPEGAYLKGLLLGGSKRMTENLAVAFQRTGTTHTVAVSGYNVTIVAAFLMEAGIFFGLWRQQVFSFAVMGIILFVLATGAPASAVRAGIMGALVIWAMKEGRLANSRNAILLAASVMLLINPLLLRYDAGFQLSFLATLGIVWLSPVFEEYFEKMKRVNLIKETIFLSLAAQIFVLPVILSNFENLSLVSPLANLLILPAIPYIMLGGFVSGIIGFIFFPLGKIIGFLPYILLKIELEVVSWLANLHWASLEIKNFGWIHLSVYYIILTGFLIFHSKKKQKIAKIINEK